MGKKRSRRSSWWERVVRPAAATAGWLGTHLSLVALAVLIAVAYFLATQARSRAYGLDEFTVYPEVFRTRGEIPEWLGAEDVREFRDAAATIEPFSAFESGVHDRFQEVFSSIPWCRGVTEVRPVLPDGVEVTVKIRKPVAAVERSGWYYLVDRNAAILPGRFSRPPHGFSYPVPLIHGVNVSRPPRTPGVEWEDRGVREGVAVALELYALYNSELGDRIRIDRIDVTNVHRQRPRDSEIVLWTSQGVSIQWGRSLLFEGYGENTTGVKLDHLRLVDRECPGLRGLRSVGLLYDEPVWAPVAAADSGADADAASGRSDR